MITLEAEVIELKARIEQLEAKVRKLAREDQHISIELNDALDQRRPTRESIIGWSSDKPPSFEAQEPLDQDQLLVWLKSEGLVVPPPPMAHTYAERWQTLSKEQKQTVRQELDHLPPGPMVSDIIIENRR